MELATRVRHRLKRMCYWAQVPILGGPARGCRFGLFTGSRFVRGTYGQRETALFSDLVHEEDVVFDIGAHVGYFTLLASRLVGPRGKVLAFEPASLNLCYLNEHRRVNRLSNVQIWPVAVGRRESRLSFDTAGGTGRGRLVDGSVAGEQQVRVVGLDELYEAGELPGPNLIKMDIEGVEAEALRGATRLLAEYRPTILLSVHGNAAKFDCESLLREHEYRLSYLKKSTIIAVPRAA